MNYEAIEDRLRDTFRYVTPVEDNRDTFSYEFASIIRDAGGVFSSALGGVIRETPGWPSKRQVNAGDFWTYLKQQRSNIDQSAVLIQTARQKVHPFENVQRPRSPAWWHAYRALKHTEVGNVGRGNVENAIHAVAALAVLVACDDPEFVPLPSNLNRAVSEW